VLLKQHAADPLPQGANVAALDAAHLGIEVPGQWVPDGKQCMELRPAQLL
jgi:hypothetical protein